MLLMRPVQRQPSGSQRSQRDLRSDSARGLCDMMALRGSLGPVARVMAQRAEPTPPKKPLSAYFLWLGENRARIAGSLGEDGKKAGLG
eukprot:s5550_g1.t1